MSAAFRFFGNVEPLDATSTETSATGLWSSATTAAAIAALDTVQALTVTGDSVVDGDVKVSATSTVSYPAGADFQQQTPCFCMCFKDNTDETTITTKNVWVKMGCSTVTTPPNLNTEWTTDATGRATYTGTRARFCHFHCTITTVLDTNKGRDAEFAIFRGSGTGTPVIQMCGRTSQYIELKKMSSATINTIGPALAPGDFVELWVRNLEKAEDINVMDFDMIGVMLPNLVPAGSTGAM